MQYAQTNQPGSYTGDPLEKASEDLAGQEMHRQRDALIEQKRDLIIVGIVDRLRKSLGMPLNQKSIARLESIFGVSLDNQSLRDGRQALEDLDESTYEEMAASLCDKVQQILEPTKTLDLSFGGLLKTIGGDMALEIEDARKSVRGAPSSIQRLLTLRNGTLRIKSNLGLIWTIQEMTAIENALKRMGIPLDQKLNADELTKLKERLK